MLAFQKGVRKTRQKLHASGFAGCFPVDCDIWVFWFGQHLHYFQIFLPSVPTHICMCGEILAVSIKTSTHLGCRWRLVMYKLTNTFDRKSSLDKESTWYWRSLSGTWTIPLQITHPPDEDHSLEVVRQGGMFSA